MNGYKRQGLTDVVRSLSEGDAYVGCIIINGH